MNQKRAKHYRRVARDMTVGYPDRSYERAVTAKKGRTTIRLAPNCTRAEYRMLKRQFLELRAEGAL